MNKNKPTRIFIHTTDADYEKIPNQFFAVNRWHKKRFGEYCKSSMGYYGGYHILISNGKEYRYREDREESCAAKGYNTSSLSVAIGFDGDIQMPKPKDIELLKKRLRKWSDKYQIPLTSVEFVGPHRLVNHLKTCYGSLLSDDWGVKLMQEVEKDSSGKENKETIENDRQFIIDALKDAILRLTILVGEYTNLINKRNK